MRGFSATEVLTIILVILKLTGTIDSSWLLVFAPSLIKVIVLIIIFVSASIAGRVEDKKKANK